VKNPEEDKRKSGILPVEPDAWLKVSATLFRAQEQALTLDRNSASAELRRRGRCPGYASTLLADRAAPCRHLRTGASPGRFDRPGTGLSGEPVRLLVRLHPGRGRRHQRAPCSRRSFPSSSASRVVVEESSRGGHEYRQRIRGEVAAGRLTRCCSTARPSRSTCRCTASRPTTRCAISPACRCSRRAPPPGGAGVRLPRNR